jgi:hypothetical protein
MRSLCVLVFASCFSANLFADIVDSGAGFAAAIQTVAGVSSTTDSPAQVIVLNSPAYTYSASQTAAVGNTTGSVSVNISPGAGNVGLHGSASSDALLASDFGSLADADFDLYWYDQFNITGTGPETFEYTLTLDGNASVTGAAPTIPPVSVAHGGLALYANASYQTWGPPQENPGCSALGGLGGCGEIGAIQLSSLGPQNGSTLTGDVTLDGGQSVELGLYLWARVLAANDPDEGYGSANVLAQLNAADTGYFTLTPVTPGAGFTTASGLTYSANPDVATPEPAYTVLCGLGFMGVLAFRRFRKN